MMKVALIGATSHVAKNLIYQNQYRKKWELYLYARNTVKLKKFFEDNFDNEVNNIFSIDDFLLSSVHFDAVINCVGFGTPTKVTEAGVALFQLTESIDNLIIEYLDRNQKTVYVNFSSGAVYGISFDRPVDTLHKIEMDILPLNENEFYRIAKLNSEAKHRSLKNSNIIDIRLFSLFSRFIDLNGKYFLTEIVDSLKNNKPFRTSKTEIYRDYVSSFDLYTLVNSCVCSKNINIAVDLYSRKHISKSSLINELCMKYGLDVEYIENVESSPTGLKSYYYSNNKKAMTLFGYKPQKSSIETIIEELNVMLENK